MKPIHEMVVLVEPNCIACVRVLHIARILRDKGIVSNLLIIDRIDDPATSRNYGVVVFPATFINGHLAFYGEFSIEGVNRFLRLKAS